MVTPSKRHQITMNRFVHRFVSHPSKGIVSREQLFSELESKSMVWFGEFHSEDRIVALQKDLLVRLCAAVASSTASSSKLHVVLEHFSFEMQDLLRTFQTDPDFGFDDLKASYQRIGTESHNLDPYEGLLLHCKGNHASRLHGGFLPRPLASRWYKAGSDANEKRSVLEECYQKDYLPPPGDPRHGALMATNNNNNNAGGDNDDRLLLDGSRNHFRLVRSMMSGEELYEGEDNGGEGNDENDDYLRGEVAATPIGNLYQAQLLKDHAMGYHLSKLVEGAHKDDRFLVIAGIGHLKHHLGVPERFERYVAVTKHREKDSLPLYPECENGSTVLIGSQMLYETYLEDRYEPLKELNSVEQEEEQNGDDDDDENSDHYDDDRRRKILNELYTKDPNRFDQLVLESEIIQGPMFRYRNGGFQKPSVDYCYVYDEDDENVLGATSLSSSCPSSAKAETQSAYNSVGATAGSRGNLAKARAIMTQLGYTEEDMDLIGEDCLYNFQGVANPHGVAKLQPGETVLDLGSGLGVDSVLASKRAGSVLGVDLAARQVSHSRAMAKSKQLGNAEFLQGDAEHLSDALHKHGIGESHFDVCISNGAFCLIPDKKRAFAQVYRALKPGGRMAISTTTIQRPLGTDFEWPVCMRMFANLEELKPICEEVGFYDVEIVDAESPMELEFETDITKDDNPERFKIHGKYADQYAYLEEMDMDQLCKIVTVYGRKPLS
eukprot:jgi/Psemu1/10445/gm1.10445_g